MKKRKTNKLLVTAALLLSAAVILLSACGSKPAAPEQHEIPSPDLPALLQSYLPALQEAGKDNGEKDMADLLRSGCSLSTDGELTLAGTKASQYILLRCPNMENLPEQLSALLQEQLTERVLNAGSADEIYTPELAYRPELLEEIWADAVKTAAEWELPEKTISAELRLSYNGEEWTIENGEELLSLIEGEAPFLSDYESFLAELKTERLACLPAVKKTYPALPEKSSEPGCEPNPSLYGETCNPEEVLALLNTARAKQLLGDHQTVWTPETELVPGTPVRYYLDDTILVLVWQEVTYNCLGTFGEVVIADASQIRRKLTDDTFHGETLLSVQELSEQTNAVLALSGDMCGRRNREIGIFVLDKEIYRFQPITGDTCFITGDGHLMFSRRYEMTEQSQAEELISQNNVNFSICFGPAIVENGMEITPEAYPWGEILGKYARNALGEVGNLHYLTYNGNYLMPDYPGYLTASETAEVMLSHGCTAAYLLDGGYTACTVFHNERINPINGNMERPVSDIIYFASAVPNG